MVPPAYAKRAMPLLDSETRRRIFERMPEIRETIIRDYHGGIFTVELAKAIAEGDKERFLAVLESHPVAHGELFQKDGRIKKSAGILFQFLDDFTSVVLPEIGGEETIPPDKLDAYYPAKEQKLRQYVPRMASVFPVTFRMIGSALNVLPDVLQGRERKDIFASRFAWIGHGSDEAPSRKTPRPPRPTPHPPLALPPGKMVLALSGGSAKGIFYAGFLQALHEYDIWPDIVVGASAGAVAAAALGTGKGPEEIEKTFSPRALKKIFSPWRSIPTLIRSLGSGIVGGGFGRHLKKIFGTVRFSEMADVFVVATVQQPILFGKVVIGRGSSIHNNLELSSDIQVWQAVMGSAAMQGVMPPSSIEDFQAERLVESDLGVNTEGITLPYVHLEDGAVVEYLPIATADLLLRTLEEQGLLVAVNLANLNPMRMEVPEYLSLRERLQNAKNTWGMYPWYIKPFVYGKVLLEWMNQGWERRFQAIIPLRAFGAFEAIAHHTAVQTVESVRNEGMKILVNPNAEGALDHINLRSFSSAETIKVYGYEVGVDLVRLLLGPGALKKSG